MAELPRSISQVASQILAGFRLTAHAQQRMRARGINERALLAALSYGRMAHVRGADVYAIGRKEVQRYRQDGLDLAAFDGVQVVCTPDGSILTAYRGPRLRGLRPGPSGRRVSGQTVVSFSDKNPIA